MKHPIHLLFLAAILPVFSACSKGDADFFDNANAPDSSSYDAEPGKEASAEQRFSFIATLHQTEAGEYYLQIDAQTRVYPANFRDLCAYDPVCPSRIVGELVVFDRQVGNLGAYGLLEWFDFVQQGPVVGLYSGDLEDDAQGVGAGDNPQTGTDGVDVLADWMTSLEDGFLTLHIQTWWGFEPRRHEVRLVAGTNPNDPYELLLLHFANNDPKSFQADALVCYDLLNVLPRPNDPKNTVVTLKWTNDAGQTQSRTFQYTGRY